MPTRCKKHLIACAIILLTGFTSCDSLYEPGDPVWRNSLKFLCASSPAIEDGNLYIGDILETLTGTITFGHMYCINSKTGFVAWRFNPGGGIGTSSPVVVDGRVYFGSGYYDGSGRVYCLGAKTGIKFWEFKTSLGIGSSPAVIDGLVYVGSTTASTSGIVYCLDAKTGKKVWEHEVSDEIITAPAVAQGKVYLTSRYNKAYCLDAATGKLLWLFEKEEARLSSPAVADGYVYISAARYFEGLYCLDADTGEPVWLFDDEAITSPPSISDGKAYVGSSNGIVYCLEAKTGKKVWEYQTESDSTLFASPAVTKNYVYIPSAGDHRMLCLDKDTGSLVWSYEIGEYLYSPTVADGFVYVSDDDGRLYCLKAAEGDDGAWPLFRGNPARTGTYP